VAGVTAAGLDPHFAVGREKHHTPLIDRLAVDATYSEPTSTAAEAELTAAEAMRRKLRSSTGRALYAARKHIVEPVFGQIKQVRGFRKFLLRGLDLIDAEWQLLCLTHNLLKIWRYSISAR